MAEIHVGLARISSEAQCSHEAPSCFQNSMPDSCRIEVPFYLACLPLAGDHSQLLDTAHSFLL